MHLYMIIFFCKFLNFLAVANWDSPVLLEASVHGGGVHAQTSMTCLTRQSTRFQKSENVKLGGKDNMSAGMQRTCHMHSTTCVNFHQTSMPSFYPKTFRNTKKRRSPRSGAVAFLLVQLCLHKALQKRDSIGY